MRLAIMWNGAWAGGIVLGSTFPNIHVRDEILGLKPFVRNLRARGLQNAWSRENVEYWTALQTIVNHARTFVFPSFQGKGIGKHAHAELLRDGFHLWEQRYNCKVFAIDTLCDSSDSGLFISNGWILAGQTKGFTADYAQGFAIKKVRQTSINNAALKKGKNIWQVWIKVVRSNLRPEITYSQ
jgi:GNAT superfamily N-acetyltransferase